MMKRAICLVVLVSQLALAGDESSSIKKMSLKEKCEYALTTAVYYTVLAPIFWVHDRFRLFEEMPPEDIEMNADLRRAALEEDAKIISWFNQQVLPSLPKDLQEESGQFTPLALFMAGDAISMLVGRMSWQWDRHSVIEIAEDGRIFRNGTEVVPAKTSIFEVNVMTRRERNLSGTNYDSAAMLKWVVRAARYQPDVFYRHEAKPAGLGRVRLVPAEPKF